MRLPRHSVHSEFFQSGRNNDAGRGDDRHKQKFECPVEGKVITGERVLSHLVRQDGNEKEGDECRGHCHSVNVPLLVWRNAECNSPSNHYSQKTNQRHSQDDSADRGRELCQQYSRNCAKDICQEHEKDGPTPWQSTLKEYKGSAFDPNSCGQPQNGLRKQQRTYQRRSTEKLENGKNRLAGAAGERGRDEQRYCDMQDARSHCQFGSNWQASNERG